MNDVTDVDLLSDASIFLSTHKSCENQAFNINNGDLFRWKHLWPKIAEHFGMETGPNLHMNLVSMMGTPDKKELWEETVKASPLSQCCRNQAAVQVKHTLTELSGSIRFCTLFACC